MVFTLLLIGTLTACGRVAAEDTVLTDVQSAKELYSEVLQSNIGFYYRGSLGNPYENEYLMLGDYIALFEELVYDETLSGTQFTAILIESCDIPIIVLEIRPPNPGGRLILHYSDGSVYGYYQSFRSMRSIKTDGTSCWSGGAGFIGTSALRQSSGVLENIITSESTASYINGIRNDSFFVYGEQVPEEIYRSFYEKHDQKDDVSWYAFSRETISEYFEMAWDDLIE